MANNAGIDYSLGRSNFNPETGIHFGVISQNSINLDCMEDVEHDYGKPTCPKCGAEVKEVPTHTESSVPPGQWVSTVQDMPEAWEDFEGDGGDYACETCRALYNSDAVFSDESIGWSYEKEGYKLTDCLDTDIFVLESPYFTVAQYCSPCVPGGCNLDSPYGPGDPTSEDAPTDADVRSYCLGPDWFDRHDPMPYRCFRVADGVEVFEDWLHCDQCQMLSINGVPCHETGCPNSRKTWDVRTKEWIEAEQEQDDE